MKIIKSTEYKSAPINPCEAAPLDTSLVRPILEDIRQNGDAAARKYSKKYDGVSPETFKLSPEVFIEAYRRMEPSAIQALERAADRIKRFSLRQLEQLTDFEMEIEPGVFPGQRVVPLERVGVYVPGGNFPLVSSLLMGVVPARTAGVKEIAVCTPPRRDGSIDPGILAAAYIAGVDEFYTVGGVQAIGAMAYGTESIKKVNKIVGPGNQYVTAAKKEVYGQVGIDFIAGPSEVFVIADETANPSWIAADLLAQAEHDTMAVSILVTTSPTLANQVNNEIKKQLAGLATRSIASKALEQNGLIILVDSLAEAIAIANQKAPEHLELIIENPEPVINRLFSYGTLFIGQYAAEVLGDYSSGLNHTLPTSGAARFTGGLSVRDFVKVLTTLRCTGQGFTQIGPDAVQLARLEGLAGHENAGRVRC